MLKINSKRFVISIIDSINKDLFIYSRFIPEYILNNKLQNHLINEETVFVEYLNNKLENGG